MKRLLLLVVFLPLLGFAQSIEFDKQLGAKNAEQVEQQMELSSDQQKIAYIKKVGQRLVAQLDNPLFEYKFHLVEEPSPNAFALPGGYIYITTGLIPVLNTEDELACIMGHEIIHSNNRHSVKQLKKSIVPKLLEVPGNLIGLIDENLGSFLNLGIETSNSLLLASYGRKFETEADQVGVQLAAKAGYDPAAMISALTRLSASIEVVTNQKETKSYFNDHPYTPNRARSIEKTMRGMNWTAGSKISENFLMEFDGTPFGSNPKNGIIQDRRFLHPELKFAVDFPDNWEIQNQSDQLVGIHESQELAAVITLEDPALSPEDAAQAFFRNLKPQYADKLSGFDNYQAGNRQGYLLSFEDQIDGKTMYAYALWIPLQDKLFRVIGIAPLDQRNRVYEIADRLRPITQAELRSIKFQQLKIVEARDGETLTALSSRTANELDLALTRTINDKLEGEKLKAGEFVKIVRSYPYFSER